MKPHRPRTGVETAHFEFPLGTPPGLVDAVDNTTRNPRAAYMS